MTFKFYSSFFLFLAGLALSLNVFSQKLPSTQETSLLAPAGLRIDGKNKEWGSAFQANNRRTGLEYTICNDDKNLYLIVRSADMQNTRKIFAGGLTFGINPDGKKDEKKNIQLTYPLPGSFKGGRGMRGQGGKGGRTPARERDSLIAAGFKMQLAQAKEIGLKGFRNTTDSIISIYNEAGIKAYASIDADHVFFYEAAIPLEGLGISGKKPKELVYQIRLNGLQTGGFNGGGNRGPQGGGDEDLTSPTDFWGKYTLALK